jgi:hypothetical protein
LGQYVFKVNTGNQAEAYIKAIEHIGEYVGLHYSKELQTLVEDQEEATFTEPKAPRKETEAAYGALEKYMAELAIYHKEKREYKDNKAKVFVIIFGQCTDDVKACLLDDSEFATWKKDSNVIGLLGKLRDMAFSTEDVEQKFMALLRIEKKLMLINQGPTERPSSYIKRVKIIVQVLEAHKGPINVNKLADSTSDKDKKAAREAYISMIALAGADKARYGTLLDKLSNDYLAKTDNYPATLDATLNLLSCYQTHGIKAAKSKSGTGKPNIFESSYAQTGKAKNKQKGPRCDNCGKFGHPTDQCSIQSATAASRRSQQSRQQHYNQSSDVDEGKINHWSGNFS